MPYKDEAALQRAVVKAIRQRWPKAWMFHPVGGPFQETGIPDLLVCVEGLLVGIELKNPYPHESEQSARERTTSRQRAQIAKINGAGGMAGTAITVQEALDIIERGLRVRRKQES